VATRASGVSLGLVDLAASVAPPVLLARLARLAMSALQVQGERSATVVTMVSLACPVHVDSRVTQAQSVHVVLAALLDLLARWVLVASQATRASKANQESRVLLAGMVAMASRARTAPTATTV